MADVEHPLRPDPADEGEWVRRFALLGDPTRFRLLTHMHLHPDSSVTAMAEACGVTPTAASQALRGLREGGWVEATRRGRVIHYTLSDPAIHHVLHFVGQQHDR